MALWKQERRRSKLSVSAALNCSWSSACSATMSSSSSMFSRGASLPNMRNCPRRPMNSLYSDPLTSTRIFLTASRSSPSPFALSCSKALASGSTRSLRKDTTAARSSSSPFNTLEKRDSRQTRGSWTTSASSAFFTSALSRGSSDSNSCPRMSASFGKCTGVSLHSIGRPRMAISLMLSVSSSHRSIWALMAFSSSSGKLLKKRGMKEAASCFDCAERLEASKMYS
mmetsp:Transcript_6101/g.22388  ORF Transcript_6101/g.22388 Transcript_6101/m.22388 type:complete len:226 (-) Transcript_6101:220-897(-)